MPRLKMTSLFLFSHFILTALFVLLYHPCLSFLKHSSLPLKLLTPAISSVAHYYGTAAAPVCASRRPGRRFARRLTTHGADSDAGYDDAATPRRATPPNRSFGRALSGDCRSWRAVIVWRFRSSSSFSTNYAAPRPRPGCFCRPARRHAQ